MSPCLFALRPFIAILSPPSEDPEKGCKEGNRHLNKKWERMVFLILGSQHSRIRRTAERKKRQICVRGVQCSCSSVSQS